MGRAMLTPMLLSAMCSLSPLASAQQPSDRQFVVYFRGGDSSLTRDASALVDRVAAAARAHRPVRIELIGVNDGPSASRDHVADVRATAVAQSLAKAGVDPATITRAGQEKPAGCGIAAHEVVIRFEDSEPTVQTGSLE